MSLQFQRADNGSSKYNLDKESLVIIKSYFDPNNKWTDEEWERINGLVNVNAFSITRMEVKCENPR